MLLCGERRPDEKENCKRPDTFEHWKVNRRVMELKNSHSLLPTSETYSGAFLSDAKIPQLFEIPRLSKENNTSEKEAGNVINTYEENVRGKQEEIGLSEKRPSYGMDSTQSERPTNSESSISDNKDTIFRFQIT